MPTTKAFDAAWAATLRHGEARLHAQTPEYRAWSGMKDRCLNPWDHAHDRYGGRGIGIHAAWVTDFVAFLTAVGRRPTPHHSLDRIDNNRGYLPGNVRWATRSEQMRNRRDRKPVTVGDETHLLVEWAAISGIPLGRIWKRLQDGWSAERAVFEPLRADRRRRQ